MKINALLIAAFLRLSTVRSNPEPTDIFLADAVCPPVIGGPGVCFPDCHCIPDDLADCGTCPDLGNRKTLGSFDPEKVAFFSGLKPVETSLFRLDPEGCNPFPIINVTLGQPLCEGVTTTKAAKQGKKSKKDKKGKKGKKSKKNGEVQCSFRYKNSKKGKAGGFCDTNEYRIVERRVTKKSKKSKKSQTFVTHDGNCGVCSSAKDLVVNLSPTLDADAFACTQQKVQLFFDGDYKNYFKSLIECFDDLGFSQDCTFVWASNALNTVVNIAMATNALTGGPPYTGPQSCTTCATTCFPNPVGSGCDIPMTPGTCDLNPCVQCDEEASGEIFKKFSGRTRRNSGIVTTAKPPGFDFFAGTKRPCSTIADVNHTMPQCPA